MYSDQRLCPQRSNFFGDAKRFNGAFTGKRLTCDLFVPTRPTGLVTTKESTVTAPLHLELSFEGQSPAWLA